LKARIFSAVFILTLGISCGGSSKPIALNTDWELTHMDGEVISQKHKPPRLQFDLSKEKISGFGGCNKFNGTVSLDGDSLQIHNLVRTKMACPSLFEENSFLAALESGNFGISTQENRLTLKNSSHTLQFEMGEVD
tara:strand:+ start:279 stop:686 length:408 start_codon:yes stop_codon:yes gene_type:complete